MPLRARNEVHVHGEAGRRGAPARRQSPRRTGRVRGRDVEDPTVGIQGAHAATLRLGVLLGLPLWLELAAPVVLAYGFAPAPRKEEPVRKRKLRRRGKRTGAPKPPVPSAKAAAQPPLKLVAANDH
jgi:hypothetical protein